MQASLRQYLLLLSSYGFFDNTYYLFDASVFAESMYQLKSIIILIFSISLCAFTGCSLLYMNAVRRDVKLIKGENRSEVIKRLGKPTKSTNLRDTFKIRGRYFHEADFNRNAGALTAFTMGLGEVVLFPYVLVEESAATVIDSFCVTAIYDSSQNVSEYSVDVECSEL